MTKRWNGLPIFHDRVPERSGYVLNRRRPISGFCLKNSSAVSTALAKRVANASASTTSRSVSIKYQRNCRSKSVSKRSARWTIISAIFDKSELAVCQHHPYGAKYADCLFRSVSNRPTLEYLCPGSQAGVGRTPAARHHAQLRSRCYKAHFLLFVR